MASDLMARCCMRAWVWRAYGMAGASLVHQSEQGKDKPGSPIKALGDDGGAGKRSREPAG